MPKKHSFVGVRAVRTMEDRPNVIPSIINCTLQLLAAFIMVANVFWLNARTMQSSSTVWALRILTTVFLFINCIIVRFMKSDVVAWAGMAMNGMPLVLISVLLRGALRRPPAKLSYVFRPNESVMCIIMLSLVVATLLLQICLKTIYKRGPLVTLCSGDLDSNEYDDYDYLEIDGELLQLHDVRPPRQLHTKCSSGVVVCWIMRVTSVLFIPTALVFFLGAIAIALKANQEEKNITQAQISVAEQSVQHGIALISLGIFALFSSFRFSSRRRLLLVASFGILFVIYAIFQFFLVHKIAGTVEADIGPTRSGFHFLSAGIVTTWVASALFSLRYPELFDDSCCICYNMNFEQLGHCVVT